MKNITLDEVYTIFKTRENGLKDGEVKEKLEKDGLNKLPEEKLESPIITFFKQFMNPLIYVLLIAAGMSFFLGEFVDAYFILGVLSFNALVGTIQEYSAGKSAKALNDMVEVKAYVYRDGKEEEIKAENLVVGDIVLLKTGNRVPADLVLIDDDGLYLDESMLTGESIAVRKKTDFSSINEKEKSIHDKKNEVFAGTIISRGVGRGIVKAIGINTEIGKIADKMSQKTEAKPPLMVRMEKFSFNLTIIMSIAIIVIGIISFFQGTSLKDVFLVSASLAVAAIPEGLPVAIMITLAICMSRMAKRNVIVKNLMAVEALGSCTTIASDKTGTLTMNEMSVREVLLSNNSKMDLKKIIPTNIVNDYTNLTLEEKIVMASVLPNEASENDGNYIGDPVDIAFLKMSVAKGFEINNLHKQYKKIHIIPYCSEIACSASFNIIGEEVFGFVKGATERVLSMCSDSINKDWVRKQNDEMSENGLRVLALASGYIGKKGINKEELNLDSLKDLEFLGLVAMIDPLRSEANAAVKECQKAGIKVVMITGDNPKTAYAISKDLDFVKSQDEVVTGLEIRDAKERNIEELDKITEKSSVYARIEPTQKLDIVQSMQRNGEFVAVTGDGVNDSPALKNANVGIAMGKNGTDVARESANIILTDDNFASIVNGVEEGRIAFSNIRKIIFLSISRGMSEILIFIIAMLMGIAIPFFAIQLLWINVVTEGIQSVGLAFEKGEGDEMEQKPRDPKEPIFNFVMIERIVISCIVITFGTMFVYTAMLKMGFSLPDARNMAIGLFILFENMQVLNSRSESKSFLKQGFRKNPYLIIGIIAACALHFSAAYIPGLNTALGLHPISLTSWFGILLISSSVILVMELEKIIRKFFYAPDLLKKYK